MELLQDEFRLIKIMLYIGWIIVFLGLFVIISGIIALFRFPDFYSKLHAASVIECCGIPICLIGLAIIQDSLISTFKLLIITVIIFIMNPVSTHALARSSMKSKIDDQGRLK